MSKKKAFLLTLLICVTASVMENTIINVAYKVTTSITAGLGTMPSIPDVVYPVSASDPILVPINTTEKSVYSEPVIEYLPTIKNKPLHIGLTIKQTLALLGTPMLHKKYKETTYTIDIMVYDDGSLFFPKYTGLRFINGELTKVLD